MFLVYYLLTFADDVSYLMIVIFRRHAFHLYILNAMGKSY